MHRSAVSGGQGTLCYLQYPVRSDENQESFKALKHASIIDSVGVQIFGEKEVKEIKNVKLRGVADRYMPIDPENRSAASQVGPFVQVHAYTIVLSAHYVLSWTTEQYESLPTPGIDARGIRLPRTRRAGSMVYRALVLFCAFSPPWCWMLRSIHVGRPPEVRPTLAVAQPDDYPALFRHAAQRNRGDHPL